MTNEQIQALKAQMKRKRRDWTSGVMRTCDCCGQHKYTVMKDDGSAICAPCCDAEHVANLESIAETLLAERDADKALIAEQDARLIEYARIATENAARTHTVKLPTAYDLMGEVDGNCSLNDASMKPDANGCYFRRRDVEQSCAAAGITLVVEE